MSSLCVLVVTAALGVEAGWQPLPDGGYEYTIQIEPQLLGILEQGSEEIVSEVPPEIDVRRYRIIVGTGKLPRDAGPVATTAPTAAAGGASAPDFGQPAAEPQDRYGAQEPEPAADRYAMPDEEVASDPLLPGRDLSQTEAPPASDPFSETDIPDAAPTPAEPEPAKDDPWANYPSEPASPSDETPLAGQGREGGNVEQPPAKLPADAGSGPIKQATFDAQKSASDSAAGEQESQKPRLEGEPPGRPWFALVAAVVLLGCSLGGNIYLGWIAWDARTRFRNSLSKIRGATA